MAFELPVEFENRMRTMLGGEYEAFRAEYEKPHRRGVRLNTLKCDAETLARTLPFPLAPTPFSPLSYYAPEAVRMASLPLYHALRQILPE